MNAQPRIRVVAGILRKADNEILIADRARSRSMQDLWEFPGGKVIDGESAEVALGRELAEELDIRLVAAEHFQYVEHDYPDLRVAVDFFIVSEWDGEPRGAEGQRIKWVDGHTLRSQRLMPADAPVIELLETLANT